MHWLFSLPVSALAIIPIQAERPLRVTTDGAEYCQTLVLRLAASPNATAELPRFLGEEGRHLCANGRYRAGIAKLRRALRAATAEQRGG
ncbi:hypothetical protein [Roseococcus pinisoli]|uniref:Transposase n=1 Tax=Roseococcus pinisoli TaxID=2835040 RepID=A0ABS5QA38_9PROT|nr:hypothetical protein [Roseococcus pinisoli]MBS7810086.1 hypothetical protein [Roseococcus pinisoli]